MKIIKAMPFLAMGTMALGLVGVTVLAPVASAANLTQKVVVSVNEELGFEKTSLDEVQGKANGSVDTQFKVKSNVANGFKLTLADKDEDTSLRLDGNKTKAEIKTADDVTSTPGWNVTANNVTKAIPANPAKVSSAVPLTVLETASTGDATANVKFNFKTDSTVQAGTYSDEVEYSLVANPAPVASSESR